MIKNTIDRYQFTPAAERAIRTAASWAGGDSPELISPTKLLIGLLAEAESRAAEMLAARGVDTAAVLARWPEKVQGPKSKVQSRENDTDFGSMTLSAELQNGLAEAAIRLAAFPRPLELATEHLLLALVAAHDELAGWLAERGFDADKLAHEISGLYGYGRNGELEDSGCEGEGSGFRVQGSGAETFQPGGTRIPSAPGEDVPYRIDAADDVKASADGLSFGAPRNAREGVPYRTHKALFRLIDAAANRAGEGLRVWEDFVRFVWNDRHLTRQLKELRHELAASLRRIPAADLLAARDTLGDVGTTVATDAERDRPDMHSVVTANAKRLQESLRSLEEYGKILSPEMAAEIEQFRYRSYTLERAMAATSFGMLRLAQARLYVLIDGRATSEEFAQLVKQLVASGVHVLQLRDKRLSDGELLERAFRLRELTSDSETLFIMNDRPDLAVLAQADGVHVGQEELSVAACRTIVGPRMLVGVSTHSLAQARQAVLDGANYLGVGPTFASRTKCFDEHALCGPELLRAVQAEVSLPIFAIGGIDLGNLSEVLDTGVTRVAVSGAILTSDDAGQAAHGMLARLTQIAACRQ